MPESAVMREIWRDLSRGSRRLFRNNVGTGWAGGGQGRRATRVSAQNLAAARAALRPGDVVVPAGRPLHAGLAEGSADHIGWQTVELQISPAHVGKVMRLAVFLSIESKAASGRMKPAQRNWLEQVRQAGGIAVVARSVEEARSAVEAETESLLRFVTPAS